MVITKQRPHCCRQMNVGYPDPVYLEAAMRWKENLTAPPVFNNVCPEKSCLSGLAASLTVGISNIKRAKQPKLSGLLSVVCRFFRSLFDVVGIMTTSGYNWRISVFWIGHARWVIHCQHLLVHSSVNISSEWFSEVYTLMLMRKTVWGTCSLTNQGPESQSFCFHVHLGHLCNHKTNQTRLSMALTNNLSI